jgi:uncharacterized protein YjbJ (UPF0337 family)
MSLGTEENIMKAKSKFHEVKGETNEKLRKLMNDPTLEGKDKNKVGRFQSKIGRAVKTVEK